MRIERRRFLAAAAAVTAWGSGLPAFAQRRDAIYGLIGKMTVAEGKRDEMIAILLGSIANMRGCLRYIVAKDTLSVAAPPPG
jgi:hypothetical protein